MSVLAPVVATWDGENRRAYLAEGTADYYPIEDLYHEYRNARRLDLELRKYNALLRAEGNIKKGGGAFTPRYVVLLEGFKVIPFNETLQLNQLGDMITDDPDTDATLYDISGLTVPKPIFIKPSNAETVQLNSASIVFSSFQGAVWVNVLSPYDDKGSATEPNGNTERPVNNVPLAIEIALERGFDTIRFIGNLTLGLGDDISGMTIRGTNPVTSVLTVQSEAQTENAYIRDCYFTGTLDGGSVIRDCVLGTIHYFDGYIENCALTSNTIYINGLGVFLNCYAGATCITAPVINLLNVDGLAFREYNGNLKIIEKHNTSICQVGMNGMLEIDTTVDNGGIIAYGDVDVDNNGIGTFVLDDRSTGSPAQIASKVWSETTRELTAGGTSEGDIHTALDSYTNKDGYKADVSNLSADVNVVEVAGSPVTSVDDFKADAVNLSGVPGAVWAYVTRELTTAVGLTPEQEVKLDTINTNTANIASSVWNNPSRVLTDKSADIKSVNGTAVTTIDEFKADGGIIDLPAIAEEILTTDVHQYIEIDTVGQAIFMGRFLERSIYVDTTLISNGDGSQGHPFNNVTDAKDTAEAEGIRNIIAVGDIVIPSPIKNMRVIGLGLARINFNGQDVKNSKFYNCSLSGSYLSDIIAEDCYLEDGLLLRGHFKNCELVGTYLAASQSHVLLYQCMSGIPNTGSVTILMNGGLPTNITIEGYNGILHIAGADHADDSIDVGMASGRLTFESSCVNGEMIASGGCVFNDLSNGATVIDDTYFRDANIISIKDINVTSVDDFKADLSNIPAEVWAHSSRELTATLGLTAEQEAKLDKMLIDIAANPDAMLDKLA